uniref:Putative secreted protein n=1 Tax=Anopheles marajoara TaxID=58244 RepID=A0A2M4C8W1_9DIPT
MVAIALWALTKILVQSSFLGCCTGQRIGRFSQTTHLHSADRITHSDWTTVSCARRRRRRRQYITKPLHTGAERRGKQTKTIRCHSVHHRTSSGGSLLLLFLLLL